MKAISTKKPLDPIFQSYVESFRQPFSFREATSERWQISSESKWNVVSRCPQWKSRQSRKSDSSPMLYFDLLPSPMLSTHPAEKPSKQLQNAIESQIKELRELEDGWYERDGKAPSDQGLDWLLQVFGKWYPPDLDLPTLYPMFDGGVQAEWMLGRIDLTLEIDLGEKSGWFHSLNLDTNDEKSGDLLLNEESGWTRLRRLIEVRRGKNNDTRYFVASAGTQIVAKTRTPHLSSVYAYKEGRRQAISLQR